MKNYIRCPRCKKYSQISTRMGCSWTCPNCHNSILAKEERIVNQFVLKNILNNSHKK